MNRIRQVLRVRNSNLRGRVGRTIDWLFSGAGKLGSYTILAMTVIVAFDILKRFLLGAGTKWSVEITGYLLVVAMSLGLVYTLKQDGHIKIDFVVARLPRKAQNWVNLFTSVLFLIYTSLLTYLTYNVFTDSMAFKSSSRSIIDVPLWPIQLWIPLGLALISIQLIRNIYTDIKRMFGNQGGPDSGRTR